VRLAAKLTGWKIDIMSEEEAKKEEEEAKGKGETAEEKVKVHEIAKELGITSKEIIAKLAVMGVEVKGATSNISKEIKDKLVLSLREPEGPKEEPVAPVKEEKQETASEEEKKEGGEE
jgi:hypothetical protein